METQLVTVPELTFDSSRSVLNMGRVGGRKKEKKDLLFSLLEGETSLLQAVLGTVHCSRPVCHCGGTAWFPLFVMFHCRLGLDSSKGFSEMDSTV